MASAAAGGGDVAAGVEIGAVAIVSSSARKERPSTLVGNPPRTRRSPATHSVR
jgi:hypothetical protein